MREPPQASPTGSASSRGVGRARRRSPKAKPEGEARRRSPKAKPEGEARRRSPTEKQVNFIGAELTRPTRNRKQRTAHSERRRYACNTTDERREGTADCTSRASSSSSRSRSPAEESNPRKAPAPGTFQNRAEVPGGQPDASFWERSDRNGVSFPEEEGPDPSGVRPWAFALDEGIVT